MKTQRRFGVFALATLLLVASAAQASDAPVAPERWKSAEAEFRRSLEASVTAFNRGDLSGHLAIHDEDVNFMTKNGPRPITPVWVRRSGGWRAVHDHSSQSADCAVFEIIRGLPDHGPRMPYQLTVIEKPTYLHAIVTGPNTIENVLRYLQKLGSECQARQCFNVLIEENLKGRRLETWDVYQIAAENGTRSQGLFRVVAYVDVNAGGELMKFAETVANNRGVPMTVFATVAEAEKWLAGKPR